MKKTLTTLLIAIALIFAMGAYVFADTPNLNELLPVNTTTNTETEQNTQTPINTVENTNATNTNQNTPEKLVNTGIEATTIPLISIFAIASIYVYKKVREYNV